MEGANLSLVEPAHLHRMQIARRANGIPGPLRLDANVLACVAGLAKFITAPAPHAIV